MTAIRLGISTCPNDTFAFHALLSGAIDTPGLEFQVELSDVEELNQRLLAGEFDVAKASYAAALGATRELSVLASGSALGFGVGPVLLGRPGAPPFEVSAADPGRILAPGAHTTANLLFGLLHPNASVPRQVVFSEIFPALESGEADYGVCIHEGRFTYAAHGLTLAEDLGAEWERRTRSPLPLGGLFARRELGRVVSARVQSVVRASIDYALAHPRETLSTMRSHAQEFSDDVLFQHVQLYVTEETRALSPAGRAALELLRSEAVRAGRLGPEHPPFEVVDG